MINESVYTHISKEIDRNPPCDIEIPSMEWTVILLKAVDAGSLVAFARLFSIHRFAESPRNEQEALNMTRLHEAFLTASIKYRDQEWPEKPPD